MAEKVTFDGSQKLILVDKAVPDVDGRIDLDVQVDLYSDGKEDWLSSSELNKYYFPIKPIGGDTVAAGKLGTTYILQYGWRIRPYDGNHELQIEGNIYTEEGDPIWDVPSGWSHQIAVVSVVSTLVEVASADVGDVSEATAAAVWNAQTSGYTTAGSFGRLIQDVPDDAAIAVWDNVLTGVPAIVSGVWNAQLVDYVISGSAGFTLRNMLDYSDRILGLSQENYYLDQTNYVDYEGQKQMTSGRIRTYNKAASVGTNDDVKATYTITASWTGDEMDNYSVTKI